MFYAAQVRHASAPVLRAVAADVEHWAATLKTEDEGGRNGEQEEAAREAFCDRLLRDDSREKKRLIDQPS